MAKKSFAGLKPPEAATTKTPKEKTPEQLQALDAFVHSGGAEEATSAPLAPSLTKLAAPSKAQEKAAKEAAKAAKEEAKAAEKAEKKRVKAEEKMTKILHKYPGKRVPVTLQVPEDLLAELQEMLNHEGGSLDYLFLKSAVKAIKKAKKH